MSTQLHITLGFKLDNIFYGFNNGIIYQLPYINQGRYFGLRTIKPKITKQGWVYYRIRRKKMGKNKLGAIMESVDWQVDKPIKL